MDATAIPDSALSARSSEGYWAAAWRRLRRRALPKVCLGVIVVYLLVAAWVYVGWGVPDWETADFSNVHKGPSPKHWFGTDGFGRDVLAKTIHGAKVAVTVATIASVLAAVIGLVLGVMAGYFGGVVDEIITWLYSTLQSIPYILLIMAFAFVLKDQVFSVFGYSFQLTGIKSVYLALGLTGWVGLCRLIRGETLKHRDRDYVVAARAIGASNARIIFRHVVPNVFHIVIIVFSLSFVSYIHAEVILSFLGLGIQNEPSWGRMIADAQQELQRGNWWQLTAAAMAIFVISFALHIFGDALRDALDPKLKEEGV